MSFHPGINADAVRANALKAEGKELCDHCEGTGNELYAMYRRCKACGGSGEAVKAPNSFDASQI